MTLHGSGGQSIGAFIPRGETLRVYGEVNDYAGKGLSGGRMVVRPEEGVNFDPHRNVIAGNVTGFGATSGEMFVGGKAGERFAVRNGGATFVVEGVGDHGCEYMTGGTVVVLGPTGRNFGAGFSGGDAFVLDLDTSKVNPEAAAHGSLLFEPLDGATSEKVRDLVKRHAEETGSAFAAALLEDWDATAARFTHVVPQAVCGDDRGDAPRRRRAYRFQRARRLGTGVRAGDGRSALTWRTPEDSLKYVPAANRPNAPSRSASATGWTCTPNPACSPGRASRRPAAWTAAPRSA